MRLEPALCLRPGRLRVGADVAWPVVGEKGVSGILIDDDLRRPAGRRELGLLGKLKPPISMGAEPPVEALGRGPFQNVRHR